MSKKLKAVIEAHKAIEKAKSNLKQSMIDYIASIDLSDRKVVQTAIQKLPESEYKLSLYDALYKLDEKEKKRASKIKALTPSQKLEWEKSLETRDKNNGEQYSWFSIVNDDYGHKQDLEKILGLQVGSLDLKHYYTLIG